MNKSITDQCLSESTAKFNKEFLALFYILWPTEETKDSPHDVPDYEVLLVPYFGLLVLIEALLRYHQGKRQVRFADLVLNGGSGLLHTFLRVILMKYSIKINNWVHNHRLVDLPVHSVWTWTASVLLMDLTYYWAHRSMHELNILWASHQYHHSPEDVSITATLRNTFVDILVYWVFPFPLALILPPSMLILHAQFNLIHQMWLHNSVIGDLGILEYVFGTPRQHRLHHGKNPFCIDKNFGAVFMIWDRLFGTYQSYQNEEIVFGIVSPLPKTFDFLTLKYGYYRCVWSKFRDADGLNNKLSALFKGPGWAPGKPRLGLISDVPEPDPTAPRFSYDPVIPEWKRWYIGVHGITILLGFYLFADHQTITFGSMLDDKNYWLGLEVIRCLFYFVFDYNLMASEGVPVAGLSLLGHYLLSMTRTMHILSLMFCFLYQIKRQMNPMTDFGHNTMQYMKGKVFSVEIQSICLTLALISGAIGFTIAGMSRLQSCHLMFDHLVVSPADSPTPSGHFVLI